MAMAKSGPEAMACLVQTIASKIVDSSISCWNYAFFAPIRCLQEAVAAETSINAIWAAPMLNLAAFIAL